MLEALVPILFLAALLLAVIIGLRGIHRDRRRGTLSGGLEALQEIFEPETRAAHEEREAQRERREEEGDSRS